jgi:hypothetical protein
MGELTYAQVRGNLDARLADGEFQIVERPQGVPGRQFNYRQNHRRGAGNHGGAPSDGWPGSLDDFYVFRGSLVLATFIAALSHVGRELVCRLNLPPGPPSWPQAVHGS